MLDIDETKIYKFITLHITSLLNVAVVIMFRQTFSITMNDTN